MESRHADGAPDPDGAADPAARLPDVITRTYTLGSTPITIAEFDGSLAADGIAHEIATSTSYLDAPRLRDGDTVVDIGAHVGVVALWLAKRFPGVRIIALEPMPEVFDLLVRNIRRNGVDNVVPLNLAVTGDGRTIRLVSNPWTNSGGSTTQLRNLDLPGHAHRACRSITLDELFARFGLSCCPLLKIDCEGSEYEICYSSDSLEKVGDVIGEFHENDFLRAKGYSARALARDLVTRIQGTVSYTSCDMANH
jgi:FkbM family methyltransferase